MLDVPRDTHRFFIEPLRKSRHVIFSLYIRYLNFVDQVSACCKPVMTNLLNLVKHDCQSRTGLNLRYIMLRTHVSNVDELKPSDIRKLVYNEIPKTEEWKIGFVEELIDCQHNQLSIPGFNHLELEDMKFFICT